jgi:hypothetical protein
MEPLVKLLTDAKLHEALSARARLNAAAALRRTADRVDPCPCQAPGRPA